MTVTYVDVSHHDWDRRGGQLDWSRIRAATSSVVCIRATYGDPVGFNPPSPHYADMMRGARAAGFDVRGAYHNLIRGDGASIGRQVDYLRRAMDAEGAVWGMADVERYDELLANGLWPRMDDVQQFNDLWYAREDRVMVWYLPRWVWVASMARSSLRHLRGPLVASDYGSNTSGLPPAALYATQGGDTGDGWSGYGGVTPAIWQYGSRCTVPGAGTQTDVNAYRGSVAQLRALLTGGDDMSTTAEEQIQQIYNAIFSGGTSMGRKVAKVNAASLGNAFVDKADYELATVDRIEQQLAALGTAVGQIKGVDGAALQQHLADIRSAVDQVDEAVVDKLRASDPAQTAALIRAALGDQLPAVLAELQRTA